MHCDCYLENLKTGLNTFVFEFCLTPGGAGGPVTMLVSNYGHTWELTIGEFRDSLEGMGVRGSR